MPPPNAFLVPHALALASELNYIFVADRENGRVLCFFASNGTFHKEYKHSVIGTKIYSVAYAREKLYLVNGPDPVTFHPVPVRGFVLDIYSGKITSMFAPKDKMNNPHDLYVTEDASEIYVVELNNHVIYRFLQGSINKTLYILQNNFYINISSSLFLGTNESKHSEISSAKRHRTNILVHPETTDDDDEKNNMTKWILGLGSATISFIIICVVIAAIVARCQKRGRKTRSYYDVPSFEMSKLVE